MAKCPPGVLAECVGTVQADIIFYQPAAYQTEGEAADGEDDPTNCKQKKEPKKLEAEPENLSLR